MPSLYEYFIPSVDGRVLAALIMILCTLLYFYHMSSFNYWSKLGVPEISWKPIPLFGNSRKLILGRTTFMDFFLELYKSMGDQPFAGYYQGSKPFLLVADPELMRHILVKDFPKFMNRGFQIDETVDPLNGKSVFNLKDQRWKEMRARLSPTFTSGRMRAMFPLMKACANEMNECIKRQINKHPKNNVMEIKELLSCFTTDVIATCAFGVQCDSLHQPETSEFQRMGKLLLQVTWLRSFIIMLLFMAPKLLKSLRLKFNFNETEIFFRNFVKDMIEKREKHLEEEGDTKGYGDFIHMLVLLKRRGMHVMTENEENENINETRDEKSNNSKNDDNPWSQVSLDDLTSQVLVFFSAGFETTSSLLTLALFELSYTETGQKIQSTLRKEIFASMEENSGSITYESLQKMTLLEQVLSETLRLHPPAGVLSRVCSEPYKIPGTNITLDKDTVILMPLCGMQVDAKYFSDPMKFDPSRFLPEIKEQRDNYVYLPFGEGPRMCIGQRFAQMQARLGLASLLSKFKFEICTKKTTIPLQLNPRSFSTVPTSGIWLKISEWS